jgi:hypothetical protein
MFSSTPPARLDEPKRGEKWRLDECQDGYITRRRPSQLPLIILRASSIVWFVGNVAMVVCLELFSFETNKLKILENHQ